MNLDLLKKGGCSLKSLPGAYCIDRLMFTGKCLIGNKILWEWLGCGLDPPSLSAPVSHICYIQRGMEV